MENIFKNAFFGKAYKTRDVRKAIYIYYGTDVIQPFIKRHHLIYEGLNSIQTSNYEEIVSEWQEEINEEELDKLAKSYDIPVFGDGCAYSDEEWDEIQEWVEEAYKAGYRKAKEN